MSLDGAELNQLKQLANGVAEPEDYFSGKDWGDLLLPRNALCFVRRQESETDGWGLLSTKSKRYDQHRRFVFLVALEGAGQVGVETSLWSLEPGEAVLMFPHQAHYYAELAEEFSWLFITFELPLAFWASIQELRDSPRRLSIESQRQLSDFMRLWRGATDTQGALVASCLLGRILMNVLDAEPLKGLGEETELVRKVRAQVQENLQGDLSVNALSQHMGISGSRLREQFRKGAGVSLGHFVRSVRLMRATELLRDSDLSVGEIAEKSGFGSIAVFSRAFGQVYNASPSAYRKSVTNFELPSKEGQ